MGVGGGDGGLGMGWGVGGLYHHASVSVQPFGHVLIWIRCFRTIISDVCLNAFGFQWVQYIKQIGLSISQFVQYVHNSQSYDRQGIIWTWALWITWLNLNQEIQNAYVQRIPHKISRELSTPRDIHHWVIDGEDIYSFLTCAKVYVSNIFPKDFQLNGQELRSRATLLWYVHMIAYPFQENEDYISWYRKFDFPISVNGLIVQYW